MNRTNNIVLLFADENFMGNYDLFMQAELLLAGAFSLYFWEKLLFNVAESIFAQAFGCGELTVDALQVWSRDMIDLGVENTGQCGIVLVGKLTELFPDTRGRDAKIMQFLCTHFSSIQI